MNPAPYFVRGNTKEVVSVMIAITWASTGNRPAEGRRLGKFALEAQELAAFERYENMAGRVDRGAAFHGIGR